MTTTTGKRAFIVGINYTETPDARLNGCHNDALRAREYLINSRGYRKEDVTLCLDREGGNAEGTTRSGIVENILRLANASNRERLQEVYIHYSGHGTQVRDRFDSSPSDAINGSNTHTVDVEVDGKDEALVPSDYRRNGLVRDDKLNSLLREFHPGTRVLCVFDCCHSGSMADLCWTYRKKGGDGEDVTESHVRSGSETPCRVICISGCRDDQVSMDAYDVNGRSKYSGAMSSCLFKVLDRFASASASTSSCSDNDDDNDSPPSPTIGTLFSELHAELINGGFRQRPVLTSSRMLDLRREKF